MRADSLLPSLTADRGVTVTLDGTPQRRGVDAVDFRADWRYVVNSPDGSSRTHLVTVTAFTGLAIAWLTTTDRAPMLTRRTCVRGSVRIGGRTATPERSLSNGTQVRGAAAPPARTPRSRTG